MDIEPDIIIKSDGEISSDPEVDYIPLERPAFIHAQKVSASRVPEYASDEDTESSDTDSDSENDRHPKKPKLKSINSRRRHREKKPSKYNIWSSKVQEDVLTETLVSCDVTKMDRSRDVESYEYPMRTTDHGTKRRYGDRTNVHLRLSKREYSTQVEKRGASRIILDLTVTNANTDEEVAVDIANKLCEEKDDLLKRLVTYAGKDKAIQLFLETKRIEEDGGMLIMNQTRRRTPGGVYFFLVKRDDVITEDQKKEIFLEDKQVRNRAKKANIRRKNKLAHRNDLPDLLSRAEQEIAKGNRTRKESEHTENVSNPPPSPVTDGKEASSDEMTDIADVVSPKPDAARNIQSYDEEFLEIGCGADMDFFT